jgi:hypothetical protein
MREGIRAALTKLLRKDDLGQRPLLRLTSSHVRLDTREDDEAVLEQLQQQGYIERGFDIEDRRQKTPGSIRLINGDGLARLMGLDRLSTKIKSAESKLSAYLEHRVDWISSAAADLLAVWKSGGRKWFLDVDEIDIALQCFHFLDAIGDEKHHGLDQRKFSILVSGSSKTFESRRNSLAAILQDVFSVPEGIDIFEHIGLTVWRQPLLISGVVLARGQRFVADPYLGFPTEWLDDISIAEARYFLTIENLTSFQDHVRDLRDGGVVLYAGGFPSQRSKAFLRKLSVENSSVPFFHWGDIDSGGLTIFRNIENLIASPLRPHLMTPEIAMAGTRSAKLDSRLSRIAKSSSAVAPLAAWLSSDQGRFLEQEAVTPRSPSI